MSIVSAILTMLLVLISLWIFNFDIKLNLSELFEYGTFGDFVGGFVGTIISAVTLVVVYKSFKQVNDQSRQQTLAILLQSYQHTIEDYDYFDIKDTKNADEFKNHITYTGREAIAKVIKDKLEPHIKGKDNTSFKKEIENNTSALSNALINDFPTHIPSIIVSILYSLNDNKNNDLENKQIKSMLSYEERKLLLYFLLEKISKHDDEDFINDRKKIMTILNLNKVSFESNKFPKYFDGYENLVNYIINYDSKKLNNIENINL
jgi:hypothetical protein